MGSNHSNRWNENTISHIWCSCRLLILNMVEKNYDILIDEHLAEEKAEKEAHKEYINKNYVRIGGN